MQINRLFGIVYILMERERVTAKELAEHLEVSPRTVYRDIEILSGAGIPVYMSKGKGGGVSLLPEFVLNKTVITKEERAEILSALKAVDAVKTGEEEGALRKLGTLFGNTGPDWLEVDFGCWTGGKREETLFLNIKRAILEKKVLRFTYVSVKGEEIERRVEPLKLCFKGEAWYLYGYCRQREDCRFFKLRRIRKLMITDEAFQRSCKERVTKGEYDSCAGGNVKLKLKIAKEAAYRVYDEFESYERTKDGGFLTELCFPRNEWLFYYLMSFGAYLEVLEPEEMRVQLREKLKTILEKYEENTERYRNG